MSERQLHRSASGVFAAFSCALDAPVAASSWLPCVRVVGSRVFVRVPSVALYTEVVRALGLVDKKNSASNLWSCSILRTLSLGKQTCCRVERKFVE